MALPDDWYADLRSRGNYGGAPGPGGSGFTPKVDPGVPFAAGSGGGGQMTLAELQAKYGSGNVKTPTRNFVMPWNGSMVQFFQGVPFIFTDSALLTAVTAAGLTFA